jgi:hypothetical protein
MIKQKMLFGRAREVQKLFQNLHQGMHTVTFGTSGVGKTAILLEVESRLRAERTQVIHIANCSSQRNLLEDALSNLHKGKGQSNSIPIKEDIMSLDKIAVLVMAITIVGKQICGLGVLDRGLDRLSIGVGMIPRGEVGLIFASIGKALKVIDDATFSAVVIMVIITTLITPPVMKWALERNKQIED